MSEDLTDLIHSHQTGAAGDIAAWRAEIDDYLVDIKGFADSPDPDGVMRKISSIGARLIEIRTQAMRSESRHMQAFRTKELDPLIDHVEMQFKVHSRRLSALNLEWDMAKGQ